jgi:hypothetical protein
MSTGRFWVHQDSVCAGRRDKCAPLLSDMWDFDKGKKLNLSQAVPISVTYPEGCLLQRLQAAQPKGHHPPGGSSQLCFMEHEIVLQVFLWPFTRHPCQVTLLAGDMMGSFWSP